MSGFDTVVVVDWSAASKLSPKRPSKDAIWIGIVRGNTAPETTYCRGRMEAEARIGALIEEEQKAGWRLLLCFDFPFGYPKGFARQVTGSHNPFMLWDWLAARISDTDGNVNNRFDVAEQINAKFEGIGPLWGKTHKDRWPGVPYTKQDVVFDVVCEKRACDERAKAASSCFQLCYNPTVGSQVLMGLPMLSRLRRIAGVAVWPFEPVTEAQTALVEIWPGLIEKAVKTEGAQGIRDERQVALLATALSRVPAEELAAWMAEPPDEAREEAWILGAGHAERLTYLATVPVPPPLRDDCFALPAGVAWVPVDDALAHLRGGLSCVARSESLPVQEAAAGRVLAEDVSALLSNPPHPNTAVDGYGFAGGRAEGPHVLPLVAGRAAAGALPGAVPDGAAIRVLTGARLPGGVDTVVLQEDVTVAAGQVAFNGPVERGANTRDAGEDVGAGDVILRAGRRLTPADLALAAAAGLGTLPVRARLRVGVLSTGDELLPAGAPHLPGRVFDANRPMLLALAAQLGHAPVDLGHVPDDRAGLRAALDGAAARCDAILTSGGASAGEEDHVSALLSEVGALEMWRIAVKPGRPLALGLWDGVPIFGLPGNPVAALVCALIFARPALGVLAGQGWHEPQGFDVPAGFAKSKKPGRREFLRARIRGGVAERFVSEGSGRISGLSWADGLIELPDGAVQIAPGDPVRYIPFSSFLV